MSGMSAFIPTTIGFLKRAGEDFTVTGDRLYGDPVKVGLSVVRVTDNMQHTSVRADTSGSKSYADENVEQGRALVHPKVEPKIGDLLIIGKDTYEVTGVRPVYDMHGGVDHYQTELSTWV
ncbi:hypothetical protein CNR34_00020 [Pseudomonas phage nickie]|uniref:Uncharacterized protein n=1 Tax=Pseudomonas phage nickie TaxID=2048977 RepID=A0A2H4P6Y2_9CAUD|nr:hypothetical protein FDJ16_gp145 [Pseudomonas phage nickie]ATW57953.1 hypothetical protein CNR34_00020 [Pseudomonas phage nickie]